VTACACFFIFLAHFLEGRPRLRLIVPAAFFIMQGLFLNVFIHGDSVF